MAFVIVTYGTVRFAIERRDGFEQLLGVPKGATPAATASFYFHVEDVDQLFKDTKGQVDLLVPIQETWYGRREFFIRAPDGYIIGLSAMIKKE